MKSSGRKGREKQMKISELLNNKAGKERGNASLNNISDIETENAS